MIGVSLFGGRCSVTLPTFLSRPADYTAGMSRLRVAGIALLALVLLGAGLWLGVTLTRWAGGTSTPRTFNTATVLQQVQTLSQLITVKYVLEKVVVLEVPANNLIGKAVGSQDRVLLLAHGVVKAGIDLERLKPQDLQVEGKKIAIRLPPAQITDASLDEQQTKVIDRSTGLFTTFNKDLEQTARLNAIDDLRRAARSGGILKDADERAQAQLEHLLKRMGFEEVSFLPR